jgi:hypothetical protein
MKRFGSAAWNGGLREGKGSVSTESRALETYPYTFSAATVKSRAPIRRSCLGRLTPPVSPCRSSGYSAWRTSCWSMSRGELIQILPECSEELYPLYAYHPSRHLPPAKVRALLDFIQEIAVCA